MDPKLTLKLAALNSRLHALENVFLSIYPDKKQELEAAFTKFMTEAMEDLASKKAFVRAVDKAVKTEQKPFTKEDFEELKTKIDQW
jgi:hypothetical protein